VKVLKESFKYMGKTEARCNSGKKSISKPSEVTGLGFLVPLPKI
jgi:hypothetical protein